MPFKKTDIMNYNEKDLLANECPIRESYIPMYCMSWFQDEKDHVIVQCSLVAKINFKEDFRLHCGGLLLYLKQIFSLVWAQD